MLTPKLEIWKVLKKEKWSHELKRAATTTKMKVVNMRAELKTFDAADLKRICYATTSVQT